VGIFIAAYIRMTFKKFKPVPKKYLHVKRSRAGLGLYTSIPIRRGQFIIEYVGPMMNDAQADKKGGRYQFAISKHKTIDGSSRKNVARYINHSCRPNSDPWIIAGRVKIKAKRKILAGEELTYNYGKEYFNDIIGGKKKCLCDKCREQRRSQKR
jgi:uncharacterized protein